MDVNNWKWNQPNEWNEFTASGQFLFVVVLLIHKAELGEFLNLSELNVSKKEMHG